MTDLRTAIAMHPELVLAAERFSDTALTVAISLGGAFVEDAVPLGVLFKPIVAALLNDFRAALAAKIDHALNEFIQAQPTTFAGSGVAGLVSIAVVNTPPPITSTQSTEQTK